LTASIERLPTPPWLTYLVPAIAWAAVFIGVQVQQGTYQESGFYAWHLFIAAQPVMGIVGIHYLDHIAVSSFQRFGPAMRGSQAESDSALYQLTTLPARQTMIAAILGLLFVIVQISSSDDPGAYLHLASTPISVTVTNVNMIVAWIGYAVLFSHGYHQLRVIDWLFRSKAVIDPFYPQPLYALSEITSSTAILILAVSYGWLATMSGGSLKTLPTGLGLYIIVGVPALGLFIFAAPLWGAHRLLVDAKNHALMKTASAYKTTLKELNGAITSRHIHEIDIWQKALAATDLELRHVDRLATWPWSPGAVRNLIGALLIPIIVWIIQRGLHELMQ
jgi:hypothetical protein